MLQTSWKSHGDRDTKFSFPTSILILAPEMSLLTGPSDSTGGCHRCVCCKDRKRVLVTARHVSADRTTGQYWQLPECFGRQVRSYSQFISSYHGPHRNHPGVNNRPVEATVLRRQSHPIRTELPIYPSDRRLGGPQS
jgi:hypothetical protein